MPYFTISSFNRLHKKKKGKKSMYKPPKSAL